MSIRGFHFSTSLYRIAIGILLFLLAISIGIIVVKNYPKPTGRVIFRDTLWEHGEQSGQYKLMITDGNGYHLQSIALITGSPAWSPDGRYIAAGCENPTKICILDARAIPDNSQFPSPRYGQLHIKELDLPLECQSHMQDEYPFEVMSISWSPDGDRLSIVCGSFYSTLSEVCILPLEGDDVFCWDKSIKGIYRATWSPVEDVLAISFSAGIYLVDPNGHMISHLTNGWSPEWSPDGRRIVFSTWGEEVSEEEMWHTVYPGIAIIDSDGSDFRWLYRVQPDDDDFITQNILIPSCDYVGGGHCRFAWSPDGQFIAFSARLWFGYDWQIYRINVSTGEIVVLTSRLSRFYSEPDWGP